ncbi:MAG: OmpH family outer membrane protein [Clostridium sp.]|nr:OmpH family outer membrane protein [Clostridium sp.]
MKNLKTTFIALSALAVMGFFSQSANSQTIGYVNYKTVESNYNFAKQAYKDIDTKYLELQQYLMDKEKQYKNIDSPINKKNFEESVQKDFKAKNDEFTKLKMQKAEEVENNILQATKAVAADKKIDVVLDYRVIFTGGTDISQDVINYLNSPKFKPVKK